MIKYFNTLANERGDVLPNYRLQVVDGVGAVVTIYADKAGTRFTDASGNIVNYATASSNGRVSFYWEPAVGQTLQTLDVAGDLVDAEADFADSYVLGQLPGNIAQSAVTNLTTDLAAKADDAATTAALATKTATADLASTASGKGAALVGVEGGGTVQTALAAKADVSTVAGKVDGDDTGRGYYRATPNAVFDWLGIKVRCDRPGVAEVSENIPAYAKRVHSGLIGAGEVWVDSTNGSDANNGSITQPFQTISQAVRNVTPSQVYLLGSNDPASPAIYRKSEFRTTDTSGTRLKIITPLGHCQIEEDGPAASALTWTPNATFGNVYEATPTLVGSVPPFVVEYTGYLRPDGEPLRLRKYSTLTEVNNAGHGWAWDGTKIYIRFFGNRNVETLKAGFKITYADTNSRMFIYGTKILFDVRPGNSLVFNGVRLFPLYLGGAPYVYARGITVRNCFGNGMDALGAYYAIQDSYFFANSQDNFHPEDTAGNRTYGCEINCISREAGDFDTNGINASGTNNGSSSHNTSHVMRWGGTYEFNGGPNIVDTGSGKSWNVGIIAGDGRATSNDYNIYAVTGTVEMWLDTCQARRGNQGDIVAGTGCTIRTFNTTGTQSGAGTFATYTPGSV